MKERSNQVVGVGGVGDPAREEDIAPLNAFRSGVLRPRYGFGGKIKANSPQVLHNIFCDGVKESATGIRTQQHAEF